MPGGTAGVAYMTIENRGNANVTIHTARSSQFDLVEFHETRIEDGVSRMRPVGALQIDAGTSIDFEPGGKHVMLIGPGSNIVTGSSVTLEFEHDVGLLIVSATVQSRLPGE